MNIRDYIGDSEFYKRTVSIAAPLAVQNLLMSCMSMVDTLMVSWIGMVSAVGTAAQIDTLHSMVSYGCVGGIGMFASQFSGAGDERNLKRCTGLCLVLVLINGLFWFTLASFFGETVLRFYLNDDTVVRHGLQYLSISRFSLLLGSVGFCFSNMYRSTGKPAVALKVSTASSLLNVLLNLLLIFGIGPFPEMGVRGAALGTVLAQLFSVSVLITHAYRTHQPFAGSFSEMFALDQSFIRPIFARILPLIINESTFGIGQTLFVKAFGQLGREQMDAYYVGLHIFNFATFLIYGYGSAVQILLGRILGQGKIMRARLECRWHMGLAFALSVLLVSVLVILAKPLVMLFGLADPAAESLAVSIVYVFAVKASMRLYNFLIFCILRAGGDAGIIQFLDSGIEWLVGLPAAFISVFVFRISSLTLVLLIAQLEQLVRLFFGMKRVKTNKWAADLTKLVA
ncbi:MAG: MATE family efflux transporter [Solobacterium sp.]|nr:MATE family efflux transporter [Solobacterium sp.]